MFFSRILRSIILNTFFSKKVEPLGRWHNYGNTPHSTSFLHSHELSVLSANTSKLFIQFRNTKTAFQTVIRGCFFFSLVPTPTKKEKRGEAYSTTTPRKWSPRAKMSDCNTICAAFVFKACLSLSFFLSVISCLSSLVLWLGCPEKYWAGYH